MTDINNESAVDTKQNRRKSLSVDDMFENSLASVEPLLIKDMVLRVDGVGSAYFEQLGYFGCPNYSKQSEKIRSVEYSPAGRDDFVRDMYRLMKPTFNRTVYNYFCCLKRYIRWLDELKLKHIEGDYFHEDLTHKYMAHWKIKVDNGASRGSWSQAKLSLTWILKAQGRKSDAESLPSVKNRKKGRRSHEGVELIEEYRPLLKAFLRAYKGFVKCFKEGEPPTIHPLWDKGLIDEQAKLNNWSKVKKGHINASFKKTVKPTLNGKYAWLNHFSRLAAMITFCFTGQNTTPILKLKHSDVSFSNKMDGKAYFDMEKARAKYLSFDTSMGFKPHVVEFLNSWLKVSKKMQQHTNTDWVFPWFKQDGSTLDFVNGGELSPQKTINKLTRHLGLIHVTASILRQTKIDALMKVTDDVYLVSMSANNSVNTIKASYGSGHIQDHRRNIGASNNALYGLVKGGKELYEAINEAKFTFKDPMTDYDYRRLRAKEVNKNESLTPIGSRCNDITKGAAERIKKQLKSQGIEDTEDATCTDFLNCFECPEHFLVADIEDIWLMLSFQDTLKDMTQYPAINSLPTGKFEDLYKSIEAVLIRYKEVSPDNYQTAIEKHNEGSHPLYRNAYSLNDLLEIF